MSDIKVIRVPSLPGRTMMVSDDVFAMLQGKPDPRIEEIKQQFTTLQELIQKRKDQLG